MGYKASAFTTGNNTYLKKEEFTSGPQKFTIEGVEAAETPDKRPALQLLLSGGKKLTLNKTNTRVLAALCGDDTDGWTGKKIAISFDPTVMYSGRMVGGLKVRPMQPANAAVPITADEDGDIPF